MYAYVAKAVAEQADADGVILTVDETVTVGEALAGAANVVGYEGEDTAALDGYTMRVTASIGEDAIQLKKEAGDEFADYIEYVISNYETTHYGFTDDIYLDLVEEDVGETVTVRGEVLNVEPDGWPAGWTFPGPPWPPGWSEETEAEEVAGEDTSLVESAVILVPCEYKMSIPDSYPLCYRIKNYVDGMLSACAGCTASSDPLWDGVFTRELGWFYWQRLDDPWFRINGKRGGTSQIVMAYDAGLQVCYWDIFISCREPHVYVWSGRKYEGETPAGIYTRTGGCSATPTALEIEECPP